VARRTLFASRSLPVSASSAIKQHSQLDEASTHDSDAPTAHVKLVNWVGAQQALLEPDHVHWCDGSQEEYDKLVSDLVGKGVMIPLNSKLRPGSYLTRTDPEDVARSEGSTFICSRHQIDAG
jgi:phosphoenolpyruvate carboxykinase (GTP)